MARNNRPQCQVWGNGYTLIILIHSDRFPRTILDAQRTPDASIQVDFHKLEQIGMFGTWNHFDTIDGANNNARLTSCATMLIDDGQLPWLASAYGFIRHTHPSIFLLI
jgi:hypothetical protein